MDTKEIAKELGVSEKEMEALIEMRGRNYYESVIRREKELVTVYLSIHSSVSSQRVEEIKQEILKSEDNVMIDYYEKGEPWDSYRIKNADITVVVPVILDGVPYLGRGTENEMNIARNHNRRVLVYLDTFREIGTIEKIEGDSWLRTATIGGKKKVDILKEIKKAKEGLKEKNIYKRSDNVEDII